MADDFGIPGALQHGNGVCPEHGAMISRNGAPFCLRCAAEAAKAAATPAGVVDVEDPGHAAMDKVNLIPARENQTQVAAVVRPQPTFSLAQPTTSDVDAIAKAISILRSAPMPKDMKQFKAISKAIALLEKASATTQGE